MLIAARLKRVWEVPVSREVDCYTAAAQRIRRRRPARGERTHSSRRIRSFGHVHSFLMSRSRCWTFEEVELANLNWLTDPQRHLLVNPVVRLGCSVWLEGRSYEASPSSFEVIKVWSPTLAPFRRLAGKEVESSGPVIPCTDGPLDCVSVRALTIVPQWGRRRFVFVDDQGSRSPVLKVVNRVSPSTVRLGLPAFSVAVAELAGGATVGKAELDLSKMLSVEVKVAAAVDPDVVVSLVTGDELGTAWASLIAS